MSGHDKLHYRFAVRMLQPIIQWFSIAFTVVICWSIVSTITILNQWLRSLLESTELPLTRSQWEQFHFSFSKLIQMITVANDILNFSIGFGLLALLIHVTMLNSAFPSSRRSVADVLITIWWTGYVYFAIFQLFWKASEINTEVCRSP